MLPEQPPWPPSADPDSCPPPSFSGRLCRPPTCPALLDQRLNTLQGKPDDLCRFEGQVVVVVNTASYCGYTPQYEGLEKLYEDKRAQGLEARMARHDSMSRAGTSKVCSLNPCMPRAFAASAASAAAVAGGWASADAYDAMR